MRLREIERIPQSDYTGGKYSLLYRSEKNKKKFKPLPGGSRFLYNVRSTNYNPVVQIWDPEGPDAQPGKPQLIGQLTLETYTNEFPLPGALEVGLITVDEDYRGQGIAKSLYGIVLSIMKRPLVSGYKQTPGGRRNWLSLSRIPGVEVNGYFKIWDGNVDKNIDTIMGKLGAQYIGKTKVYGRPYRFFSFDVKAADDGQELASAVRARISRLYNEDMDVTTGLYAVWGGK